MQLCYAWLNGEPCFAKLMEVALEEFFWLEWEIDDELQLADAKFWAEGTSYPHPIVQNKVVDFIMERALR